MPHCYPSEIDFRDYRRGERAVWEALRSNLPDEAGVFYSVRVPEGGHEHEIDFVVAVPGAGLAVLEVKGGGISRDEAGWWSWHGSQNRKLKQNPMEQAEDGQHALQRFLAANRSPAAKVRIQHLVVLPHGEVPLDYDPPDFPRERVVDKKQFGDLVSTLFRVVPGGKGHTPLDAAEVEGLAALLMPELAAPNAAQLLAAEHDSVADQEAADQAKDVLDLLGKQLRFTVVGGAGTGKTVLAMECARQLAQDGKRVALLCYSRGLGRYLKQQSSEWRRSPVYVGLFHDLAKEWGAPAFSGGDESDYYEQVLPKALGELAHGRHDLFDAVVVDEAQDFGEHWWPSLLECLKDRERGGICVFMDEDQRVFHREASNPLPDKPFVLRKNFRNTKRIAQTFGSLSREEPRAKGMEGPRVRFIQCSSEEALSRADDAVDGLLDIWEPGQVALLTTKQRHPIQREIVDNHGDDYYWEGYFAGEDVFYGTVAGFKGLERTAVVLAVNGFSVEARAKEMLYVGLSRARCQLVVVGDLDTIAAIGGEGVRRRLCDADQWQP